MCVAWSMGSDVYYNGTTPDQNKSDSRYKVFDVLFLSPWFIENMEEHLFHAIYTGFIGVLDAVKINEFPQNRVRKFRIDSDDIEVNFPLQFDKKMGEAKVGDPDYYPYPMGVGVEKARPITGESRNKLHMKMLEILNMVTKHLLHL